MSHQDHSTPISTIPPVSHRRLTIDHRVLGTDHRSWRIMTYRARASEHSYAFHVKSICVTSHFVLCFNTFSTETISPICYFNLGFRRWSSLPLETKAGFSILCIDSCTLSSSPIIPSTHVFELSWKVLWGLRSACFGRSSFWMCSGRRRFPTWSHATKHDQNCCMLTGEVIYKVSCLFRVLIVAT